MKRGLATGRAELLAWTLDGMFVALTVLLREREFDYLFFLAVAEERRGEGIGSAILARMKGDVPLIVDTEAKDEGAANAQQRERRQQFYRRNGFSGTGCVTAVRGVRYEALCRGEFPKEAFLRFVEERAKRYRA